MALDFNGTTAFVNFGNDDTMDYQLTGDYTIGMWLIFDEIDVNDATYSRGSGAAADENKVTRGLTLTDEKMQQFIRGDDGDSILNSTGTVWTSGPWFYYSWVRDKGTDIFIFRNGVQDDNLGSDAAGTITFVGDPDFAQGALRINESGPTSLLNGKSGEVASWNVILTDAQQLALFHGVNPFAISRDALKIHCPEYDATSPTPDYTGNGNNGTITAATKTDHPPVELMENYL